MTEAANATGSSERPNVVHAPAASVHRDADAGCLKAPGEGEAGELAALVGVEDLRRAVARRQGLVERVRAEARVQRVRQPPGQDVAARPVHDRHQVEEAALHRDVRQRTIGALGRKNVLQASGELDRLIASLARHSERTMVLSDMESSTLACSRIGGPLLFGRLWERLGLGAVVNNVLDGRGFEFALERAVFVSVLHRLFVSGSDRSCEKWMSDYAIPGVDDLHLHHLNRAMAWLGEELEPVAESELAPRCVKDEIEESLFARRRDLFTDLSLDFMDTTTLSFHGEGGESLGAHGHSKDHRPDLRQMVLAVVLDGEGRPVCTEMLAGNIPDMTVLLPVVERLRTRFDIGRVCVVADRGMISAATIAALEERGLDHILGTRERGTAVIREIVLKNEKLFVPLLLERGRGDTQLFVKQVAVHGARHIVCRNEAEAEKDRAVRHAIVANLEKRLSGGDKALIGNAGYRRYLRRTGAGKAFEIDAGKLAEEARFDGIFVLRTNATMTPLNAVLRYRELLLVEDLFRRAKVQLRTRPIYHSCDAAIRGHVFCSFLALVLQKELADLCRSHEVGVEWDDPIRDLDRLQEATIEKDGKRVTTRTPVSGQVGRRLPGRRHCPAAKLA